MSSRASTSSDIGYRQQQGYGGRKPGACFACGKFGHWRAECREAVKETSGSLKISEKADEVCMNVICSSVQQEIASPVGRLKSNLKKMGGY